MSVDYRSLSAKATLGGVDDDYEYDYLLAQSQHVIADNERYYVSMMLKRNFRMINKEDKTIVKDADLSSQVKLSAGMCFYGDDEIFVVDNNDDKIVVCNRSDGSFVRDFVTSLNTPNGIASNDEGDIIVGELGDGGKQARCFDRDGNVKFTINSANSKAFSGVNYVSYDKANKRTLITDAEGHAVHVFGSDATYLFSISEEGKEAGQLNVPAGTAVDHHGNILVCDGANNRVQVFDKDGKFVSIFASDDTFMFPFDVYVTPGNEVVVVDGSVMSGWSRLQVFQY